MRLDDNVTWVWDTEDEIDEPSLNFVEVALAVDSSDELRLIAVDAEE